MVKPIIKTSITAIIKVIAICGTFLLAASTALAQEKQAEGAAKPMPMQHEHHGFMQEGMHHAVAKGVKLDPNFDMATHTITLRVGPMNLPAHTSHMKMPQPPDLIWTVPLDGWLLAYHRSLWTPPGTPCRERYCIMWRSGTRIARIFSAPIRKSTFLARAAN